MTERQTRPGRFSDRAVVVAACAVALLALTAAAYRAVLLTVADWHFRAGDLHGIESAERVLPSNARYHFARAQAVQQQDPASPEVDRELDQAVALNPRFSEAMLSWSVDKEFSGDKAGALKLLQDARAVDQQFRPNWALANFYYRQGDAAHFWPEARECLRIIAVASFTTGRYNPVPIFQLCWSMQPDAATILNNVIPHDPQIEEIYLSYLLTHGQNDAQIALASRMLARAIPADLPVLIFQIDALINAGNIETAVAEWNQLVDRKLIPYQRLDPAHGISLTDGALQVAPDSTGFDWRPLYPESVQFSFVESEHAYRFDFDGTEPQQFDLISQTVPLLPDRTYQFRSRYRAAFDFVKSGMEWTLSVNHTPVPVRVVGVTGAGNESEDQNLTLEFHTPAQTKAGYLKLSYGRQPGTTLVKGTLNLLQASLKLL